MGIKTQIYFCLIHSGQMFRVDYSKITRPHKHCAEFYRYRNHSFVRNLAEECPRSYCQIAMLWEPIVHTQEISFFTHILNMKKQAESLINNAEKTSTTTFLYSIEYNG